MITQKSNLVGKIIPKQSLSGELDNKIIYVEPITEDITVASGDETQIVIPSEGKYIRNVTVNPLPTETKNITANGQHDVRHYGTAQVNVIGEEIQPKDVIFIDYNGRILYSYTKEEFLQLNTMPSNPEHETLIAQGWNWNLEEAQSYVNKYGILCIGQMYVTKNGTTNIYISLSKYKLSPYLGMHVNGTAVVDWGDGSSTTTLTGTDGLTSTKHDYPSAGDYVIKISTTENSTISFSGYSTYGGSYILWGNYFNQNADNALYKRCVKKIEFGTNVVFDKSQSFEKISGLEEIVISKSNLTEGNFAMNNCCDLKAVVVPNNFKNIQVSCPYNYNLTYCSLPNSLEQLRGTFNGSTIRFLTLPTKVTDLTTMDDGAFRSTYSINKLIVPDNVTTLRDNFLNGSQIKSLYLSEGLTSIGAGVFANCEVISVIQIPKDITAIPTNAFNSCKGLAYITFLEHEVVPTLGSSALNNTGTRLIVVPDALYESWKTASGWSSYASVIIKASDWEE